MSVTSLISVIRDFVPPSAEDRRLIEYHLAPVLRRKAESDKDMAAVRSLMHLRIRGRHLTIHVWTPPSSSRCRSGSLIVGKRCGCSRVSGLGVGVDARAIMESAGRVPIVQRPARPALSALSAPGPNLRHDQDRVRQLSTLKR